MEANVNSTHPGNSINEPTDKNVRTSSQFEPKYTMLNTARFGEYMPFMVAETIKNDRFSVRCAHRVQTYTMKSPLMSDITMKKDYFNVPLQAILPFNFDKFYANPLIGDDVPDDVYTSVDKMPERVATAFKGMWKIFTDRYEEIVNDEEDPKDYAGELMTLAFRALIFGEYFYSNGSLMASLGCHYAPFFRPFGDFTSYDKFFDSCCSDSSDFFEEISITFDSGTDTEVTYKVVVDPVELARDGKFISFRDALQLMRENLNFEFGTEQDSAFDADILVGYPPFDIISPDEPLDLARFHAYQMVCAHFYSNDKIDFIYSADLYRQLMSYYVNTFATDMLYTATFNYNGVSIPYDWCSAHFFTYFISYGWNYATDDVKVSFYHLISALFSYRRSLRYVDYFTGSRSQPLAVGDVSVAVADSKVSVIDVTKNIQMQRFLNAVNRTGRKIEQYLEGLFGGSPVAYDYHNPAFLGHTSDQVFGVETDNTGASQMTSSISTTTRLRSNNADQFAFEFDSDRPSILIGILYFDLPRFYAKTIERHFFHRDRFDMFNPFMQYIGDQPIYVGELGQFGNAVGAIDGMSPFAYTLRHMEYKQRYNQMAGGFVEYLPAWAFQADKQYFNTKDLHISPDYIRSRNSELDDFFVSLSGFSLASYFHFIIGNDNFVSANRPMSYAPSIL